MQVPALRVCPLPLWRPLLRASARFASSDAHSAPPRTAGKLAVAVGGRETVQMGPPDSISNIRPLHITEKHNETPLEKALREKRIQLNEWHQSFWRDNNERFLAEKSAFEEKRKAETGEPTVSAEDLSVFYKDFLDRNYANHLKYNNTWWRENFGLLMPSLKIVLAGLFSPKSSSAPAAPAVVAPETSK